MRDLRTKEVRDNDVKKINFLSGFCRAIRYILLKQLN